MSNHFTGLSLGPPLGDQRLDLCDVYAFQSPADKNRTVIILNANPNADALHPDAIYRLNIDNDGDYLTDISFSYVFSKPQNGRQTVNVFVATGSESRSDEAVGTKIIADAEVSFSAKPNIIKSGHYTFFAGSRSDAFFFDFDGIKNLFDTRGKRNFTEPDLGGKSPWTGVDSNTEANVFSTVIELPTSELDPKPEIFFGDAAHRPDHPAGRTWDKRGETPIVETTGARHRMSLISAITARGHMRFMIKEKGGVNAAVFIEFLKRLMAGAKRAIFLIVDRGPAHIAKKTRAFVDS